MEREDGTVFDCKVPAFALDSKQHVKSGQMDHVDSTPTDGGGGSGTDPLA